MLALAFAAVTLAARVAGAGWGTAATFGEMTFTAVLVAVLLLSPRPTSARDSG